MDAAQPPLVVDAFEALTLGIAVFFVGERITRAVPFLQRYGIPEPVSGGLIAALVSLAVVLVTGREVEFELGARDALLIYFFTTVGLNARLSDLACGGRTLTVMLALTVAFMVVQNLIGVLGALLWGLPLQAGVMMGTTALIGGHGTAIAWGPVVQGQHAVAGAAELGIAAATIGLIMASLLGGPIANGLIARRGLTPAAQDVVYEGSEPVAVAQDPIDNGGLLRSVFWVHVAIMLGLGAHEALDSTDVKLPPFVPCLLAGILLTNVVPRLAPRLSWPANTPSMALLAAFSLSVFLSMSLMSMELWTLAASAGVLAVTMALQAAAATLFILLVVFPALGRDYVAAVLSAGFAGFALGATPTAIANMNAVTQRHGPAPVAFIVLPLVSAFFVDLINAALIQLLLTTL